MNKEALRGEIEKIIYLEMQKVVNDCFEFLKNDPILFSSDTSLSTESGVVREASRAATEKIFNLVNEVYSNQMMQSIMGIEVKIRNEMKRRAFVNGALKSASESFITEEDVRKYINGH